jgi:hypothetical protein
VIVHEPLAAKTNVLAQHWIPTCVGMTGELSKRQMNVLPPYGRPFTALVDPLSRFR